MKDIDFFFSLYYYLYNIMFGAYHGGKVMEILQLRYFCDAAELENFSKVAEKNYAAAFNQ